MAKVERFEDLLAWQRARSLRQSVRHMLRARPFLRERDFRSQISRAALSIMSNIAEGFERGTRAEFAHFLATAKASCGEVRSLLYAAFDDELIDETTFKSVFAEADEVSRIVGGLRAAVVKQRDADRSK